MNFLSACKSTTLLWNQIGNAFTEVTPVARIGIWIALAIVGTAPAYGQVADKIIQGGSIVTVNDAKPFADAVAIKDGKILAVGSNDEIAKHKGANTEVVDLAGRALLPGFIDGHGHCFATGIQAASANLLAPPDYKVTDIPGISPNSRRSRSQTLRRNMESFSDSDTTMPS